MPTKMETTSIYETAESGRDYGSADRHVDRAATETRAYDLIVSRNLIEQAYKTDFTYQNDARTLLFEALTASGHLSRVEVSGSLDEIHKTMLSVLINSYSDDLPEHEKQRRFQEICEELTIQEIEWQIATGLLSPDTQIATISDYPDTLNDEQAEKLGYRPSNHKGMVRNIQLIGHGDGKYTRLSKQVSRSSARAHGSAKFLRDEGFLLRHADSPDLRVLGTQLVHEAKAGVVGLMKQLDAYQGQNIRYGEVINERQIPYEHLEEESIQREERMEHFVDRLADFTKRLDNQLKEGRITRRQYDDQLGQEIRQILRAICVANPSYVRDCFGQKVEEAYFEASNLAASGDYSGASSIIERSSHLEQTVTFCGQSISPEEAKRLGVEADSVTNLLKLNNELGKVTLGRCRVQDCPSPKPTEVGGCSVCLGSCQKLFDKGWSYVRITRFYQSAKKAAKTATRGQSWFGGKESVKQSGFKLIEFKKPLTKIQKREKIAA